MKKISSLNIVIVLLIIVVIILYIVSLGNIDSQNIKSRTKAFRDNREEAKKRHRELTRRIEENKKLKEKLDRKFKRIYFGVRLGLIIMWLGAMFLLYYFNKIKSLGDFLNYSEVGILIIITLNYIVFGSISSLKNYIELIELRIENWVYIKHTDLENQIKEDQSELKKIEGSL